MSSVRVFRLIAATLFLVGSVSLVIPPSVTAANQCTSGDGSTVCICKKGGCMASATECECVTPEL